MLDVRIHCMVRTIDNLANNTKLPYHPGPFIALIDASPAKTVKEDKTAHRDPTDIKVPAIPSKHPVYRIIASSHRHCGQNPGWKKSIICTWKPRVGCSRGEKEQRRLITHPRGICTQI